MATVEFERVELPSTGEFRRSRLYKWEGLQLSDDGQWLAFPDFADRTVQITGVAGAGGSLTIEGSLDPTDSKASFIMTDPQGNPLILTPGTDGKGETVSEATLYIRPHCKTGDGDTNLTLLLLVKGQ